MFILRPTHPATQCRSTEAWQHSISSESTITPPSIHQFNRRQCRKIVAWEGRNLVWFVLVEHRAIVAFCCFGFGSAGDGGGFAFSFLQKIVLLRT